MGMWFGTRLSTRDPWALTNRTVWLGLGICAVPVVAVGVALLTAVSSGVFHAVCALAVVLLLLGAGITIKGARDEVRSRTRS